MKKARHANTADAEPFPGANQLTVNVFGGHNDKADEGGEQQHMWVDGGFTTHRSSQFHSSVPPLMEYSFSYDKESNRTAAYDARIGAQQNLSFEYTYDGLDRLEEAVSGGSTSFSATRSGEQWDLDMLGNGSALTSDDASPYGSFGGSDTEQDRRHRVGPSPRDALDYTPTSPKRPPENERGRAMHERERCECGQSRKFFIAITARAGTLGGSGAVWRPHCTSFFRDSGS